MRVCVRVRVRGRVRAVVRLKRFSFTFTFAATFAGSAPAQPKLPRPAHIPQLGLVFAGARAAHCLAVVFGQLVARVLILISFLLLSLPLSCLFFFLLFLGCSFAAHK